MYSCIKMKYKGDFNPQSFLDPESYAWQPLDTAMKARLDKQKYISPSRETSGTSYPPESAYPESTTTKTSDHNSSADEGDSEDDDDGMETSISLWDIDMPGILTKKELIETVDLDQMKIRLRGNDYLVSELMGWMDGDIDDPTDIKGMFAGMAAALGAEVVKDVIVHIS